ncbi:hypothetical protein KSS87_016768 [Heliosperma pusillum]|nr:hypothetical protein KSS87_016768 [Heliosperma pusillum]
MKALLRIELTNNMRVSVKRRRDKIRFFDDRMRFSSRTTVPFPSSFLFSFLSSWIVTG